MLNFASHVQLKLHSVIPHAQVVRGTSRRVGVLFGVTVFSFAGGRSHVTAQMC